MITILGCFMKVIMKVISSTMNENRSITESLFEAYMMQKDMEVSL